MALNAGLGAGYGPVSVEAIKQVHSFGNDWQRGYFPDAALRVRVAFPLAQLGAR